MGNVSRTMYGFTDYIVKHKKAHRFTYRPKEYYKNPQEYDLTVALCCIANLELLHFSFGADILEKAIREDKNVFLDRAVIWDLKMLDAFKLNRGIYTSKPVREFDLILISAYMVLQTLNVVPFLLQCRMNPIKEKRNEIVVLGGNVSMYYKLLVPYVDVFYFGDGEKYIHEILRAKRETKTKTEFIEKVRNTEGLKDCIYTGIEDHIRFAVNENIATAILGGNDFISKPVNKVLEIARGCKYACSFCFLGHSKHPYRYNTIEDLEPAIKSFKAGTSVYPFAPDEASYKYKQELIETIYKHGCKAYSYNKRFDSFNPTVDLGFKKTTSRIVFGVDGISERMRKFARKGITNEQILNGVKASVEDEQITKIKLNYIISYPYENEADWKELEESLLQFIDYRRQARPAFQEPGEKIFQRLRKGEHIDRGLMFHIAPTPFTPEPGTPFEFMPARYTESIKLRFEKLILDLSNEHSFFKLEGMNGVETWRIEVLLNRSGWELQEPLMNWFKWNGYKVFGGQSVVKFWQFLKTEGVDMNTYFEEQSKSKFPELEFRYPEERRRMVYDKALKMLEQYEIADS